MTKEDVDSFNSMMNDISEKKKAEDAAAAAAAEVKAAAEPGPEPGQYTCPFAGGLDAQMPGLGGLDALGGMLGAAGGATGDADATGLSGEQIPSSFEPEGVAKLIYGLMNVLEVRVKEALNVLKVGVCPQVAPVNIFLSKTPFKEFEELMSKEEGLDALDKMGELKSQLKMKFAEVEF